MQAKHSSQPCTLSPLPTPLPQMCLAPAPKPAPAGAWGNYAEGEDVHHRIAAGRTREGRVARRARRRAVMQQKRAQYVEERAQRKQMVGQLHRGSAT